MARVHKKHGFHVELWQHKTSLSAECWQVAKYHIYHIYHHIYIYTTNIKYHIFFAYHNDCYGENDTTTSLDNLIQSFLQSSHIKPRRSSIGNVWRQRRVFFSALNVGIFQCHKPTFSDLFGDGLYMFTPLSAVILGMVSYQVDWHFSSSFAGKSQRLTQRVAKHPCRPVECEKLGSDEFGEYQNNIK